VAGLGYYAFCDALMLCRSKCCVNAIACRCSDEFCILPRDKMFYDGVGDEGDVVFVHFEWGSTASGGQQEQGRKGNGGMHSDKVTRPQSLLACTNTGRVLSGAVTARSISTHPRGSDRQELTHGRHEGRAVVEACLGGGKRTQNGVVKVAVCEAGHSTVHGERLGMRGIGKGMNRVA
jgi:hypothetical protein